MYTLKFRPNVKRAANHVVTGLSNVTAPFTYVVFSDPQYGLLDVVDDNGDGTNWSKDKVNMESFAGIVNQLQPKPEFIFCTGDLSLGSESTSCKEAVSKNHTTDPASVMHTQRPLLLIRETESTS